MFRMENLFVPAQIQVFKNLAKSKDWYTVRIEANNNSANVKHSELRKAGMPESLVRSIDEGMNLIPWITLSEFLKHGPKTVELSYENCIALEKVKINLPFDDYQQPFPTMSIELPEKYRNKLYQISHKKIPRVLFIHHIPNFSVMMCWVYGDKEYGDVAITINKSDQYMTMEDQLKERSGSILFDPANEYTHQLERVALNACLIMTNYGLISKGIHRLGGKKHKNDIGIEVFESVPQHIKFYNQTNSNGDGTGTHASPHPHWRSGHHRMQPHGPNNSLRKRIFVPPVFVCGDRFKGDIGDTEVTYEGV